MTQTDEAIERILQVADEYYGALEEMKEVDDAGDHKSAAILPKLRAAIRTELEALGPCEKKDDPLKAEIEKLHKRIREDDHEIDQTHKENERLKNLLVIARECAKEFDEYGLSPYLKDKMFVLWEAIKAYDQIQKALHGSSDPCRGEASGGDAELKSKPPTYPPKDVQIKTFEEENS